MQDETAVKLDMLSKSLDMKEKVLIEILAQTKKAGRNFKFGTE